jgi:hypothetical protein
VIGEDDTSDDEKKENNVKRTRKRQIPGQVIITPYPLLVSYSYLASHLHRVVHRNGSVMRMMMMMKRMPKVMRHLSLQQLLIKQQRHLQLQQVMHLMMVKWRKAKMRPNRLF